MKKLYLIFISCLFMLGISTVKADTNITVVYFNENYSAASNARMYLNNSEIISALYNEVYSNYSQNYINFYPFYDIDVNSHSFVNPENYNTTTIDVTLVAAASITSISRCTFGTDCIKIKSTYDFSNNSIIRPVVVNNDNEDPRVFGYFYQDFNYKFRFYSNYRRTFSDFFDDTNFTISNVYSFSSSSVTSISYTSNDYIPDLQELLGLNIISDPNSATSTYQEVNLNDYPYVALTLKNYSSSSEFSSLFYVKGQLCLTPVYNYGMKEKKEFYTGYQVQGCTEYYNDFTPTRVYILNSDLQNHVVYYLKAYDTSKFNFVKVDTSIFDITYITSDNEDNPSVVIEGRSYPTIPYSDLTDTATLSEEQGYVSGVVCAVGDLNCTSEFSNMSWTDIFNSPLQALKTVWSAITAIFSLITAFILLLPPVMQNFLYLAFSIAIILGIIKIIL